MSFFCNCYRSFGNSIQQHTSNNPRSLNGGGLNIVSEDDENDDQLRKLKRVQTSPPSSMSNMTSLLPNNNNNNKSNDHEHSDGLHRESGLEMDGGRGGRTLSEHDIGHHKDHPHHKHHHHHHSHNHPLKSSSHLHSSSFHSSHTSSSLHSSHSSSHHSHHHHHHHRRRKRIMDKAFRYEDINKKLSNMRRKSTQRRTILDKDTEKLLKQSLTKFFFMGEGGEDDDRERIALVLSQMKKHKVKKGEILMTQGDEGGMMFVVVDGCLEIFVDNNYIRDVERGTVVGELALLYNAPRSATVIAKTDCILWSLKRETFREVQTVASSASLVQRSVWLRQLPILHSLENEDISKLAALVKTKTFYPGDIIFVEGALVSTCYLIEMGSVEAQSSIHDSVEELVETLQVEYSQITDTTPIPSLPSSSTITPVNLSPVISDTNLSNQNGSSQNHPPSTISSIKPFSNNSKSRSKDEEEEEGERLRRMERRIIDKLNSMSDKEDGDEEENGDGDGGMDEVKVEREIVQRIVRKVTPLKDLDRDSKYNQSIDECSTTEDEDEGEGEDDQRMFENVQEGGREEDHEDGENKIKYHNNEGVENERKENTNHEEQDEDSKIQNHSPPPHPKATIEIGPGGFLGTPILKSGAGFQGWKWKDTSFYENF